MMTNYKSRILVLLITGLIWAGLAQAQESVNATGNDISGSGGTVAYSIGQVVYTMNSSTSGTVSQGVQHAYEIFTVGFPSIESNILFSVFPNPTAENLILHIGDFKSEELTYQLLDMQGKTINSGIITSNQTEVEMIDLPSSTYFIKVVQDNKQVQTFKIIKH